MAVEQQDRGEAQVHWLVCGQFGIGARGKTLELTRADFNEALEKAKLTVTTTVPDAIGSGAGHSVTLKIDSLKTLTLKHVVGSVPELTKLAAKADEVSRLKDPSKEELIKIFGPGKLVDAMLTALGPDEPPPGATPASTEGVTGDQIFEKGKVEQNTAKSAINLFMRAASSSSRQKPKPSGRKLRDLVEETVWAMAKDILDSPEVASVETAWRGLRFLLQECPLDSHMKVVLLESSPAHIVEDLTNRERGDDVDEPECIFVPYEWSSREGLLELAALAEQDLIPIVVGVDLSLLGQTDPHGLPDAFASLERARNEEAPEWLTLWDELRKNESTRWLCTVTNRIALNVEGKGLAERKVFGSGVWAVAGMLAASYHHTGGFARIFGKTGSLRGPATHTISTGSSKDTAAPTEAFYAISPCETLAKNGLLGIGSARNSDTLALLKAPMLRAATDAVPLSAQILTGRVVRFATWVKPQLPEGCNSKTAHEIFVAAASVFLFPGQEAMAHVKAAVTNIEGEAHVVVQAVANPAIASIPFEIAFPLPLNWSVPAPEGDLPGTPAPKASNAAAAQVKTEPTDEGGGIKSANVGFGVDDD